MTHSRSSAPTPARVLVRRQPTARWRDAAHLLRGIHWTGHTLTLALDAQRVREQHFSSAVRDGDWRVEWAHWQASALEGSSWLVQARGDTVEVTLANVREVAGA